MSLIKPAPDQCNLPFTGNSDTLIDKLLTTISLTRSEVFIANILKHRLSVNRDPLQNDFLSVPVPLSSIIN